MIARFTLLVVFFGVLSAHEPILSDDNIEEQFGLILDGHIKEKEVTKIKPIDSLEKIHRYEISYVFKIDSVIKGFNTNPETIKLVEFGVTDDQTKIGSHFIGDTFRYFAIKGKEIDGAFVPKYPYDLKQFKAGKATFPVDPNYVRKHLYQNVTSRIPKNIETSRSDSKALNGSSDSSNPVAQPNRYNKKVSIWWLLFIAIFCAIIFLIARSKIKS